MAESISRSLRGGSLEGEHAPALTIKDSLRAPVGSHALNHFLSALLSSISAGKSQSRGLVLVAFSQSPSFYLNLLKRKGLDASFVRILDCFSDPLGWKDRIQNSGRDESISRMEWGSVFKDVRDVDKLLPSILELGKEFAREGKARFAVAIDLISNMLRHAPLPSVAGLLSNLRGHDQISCIFWSIHSDLHELRISTALEYISSMVASLESLVQSPDGQKNTKNLFWLEQTSHRGRFRVHLKCRNGRVKQLCEEFYMEQEGMKFFTVSSENTIADQNILPKVQFNLQLSEKERVDRARVVLPFEHQGNGGTIQIYDGRRSLTDGKDPHLVQPSNLSTNTDTETNYGKGEIHYIRDSDDEDPDSDEDPDDDLDI